MMNQMHKYHWINLKMALKMIIQFRSTILIILDIILIHNKNNSQKPIKLEIQNLFYQEERFFNLHPLNKLKSILQINKLVLVQQLQQLKHLL